MVIEKNSIIFKHTCTSNSAAETPIQIQKKNITIIILYWKVHNKEHKILNAYFWPTKWSANMFLWACPGAAQDS